MWATTEIPAFDREALAALAAADVPAVRLARFASTAEVRRTAIRALSQIARSRFAHVMRKKVFSSSQPRRSTSSRRMKATCVMGPPKAMTPTLSSTNPTISAGWPEPPGCGRDAGGS